MRLTRIYTPFDFAIGKVLSLTPDGANHIARVLRAKIGDALQVFDGKGREYSARIVAIQKNDVAVELLAETRSETDSQLAITLVQGISRGERMDIVVQKATELGVTQIVPVLTARSVVKLDAEQAAKKQAHWRSITVGACEQCGRNRLPEVVLPQPLVNYLGTSSVTTRLILDPMSTNSMAQIAPSNAVELLIGPEGGLADDELAAANRAGYVGVRLGPRILRTETAAIAAIAVLQSKLGDLCS